ncbi:MAG: nucleotide exchange factor GrpE [Planctomycetaceae bacterium]
MTTENEDLNDDAVEPEQMDESADDPENTAPNDELQRLRGENAELKDRALRTQAELENFRRRTQKDAIEAMKYQSLPVIRDFLPGIDNLQRAIAATEQSGDTQNLVDGIKMVAQQFVDALKSHSCEVVNPVGEPFDPNLHEALSQVPSAEHEPMTILQVVEAGYRLHDRMIRPAKVLVTCAPPEE